MANAEYLVVISDSDPVATAVAARWGTGESTGLFVDGAAVRQLGERAWALRRPGPHIHDEHLDRRLPPSVIRAGISLVFPSIHRSEQNVQCLTVHPLGNPGSSAEVGGEPRRLVPTDPRRMAALLRRLHDERARTGMPATYEATHHGPLLDLPAFFAEIGYGTAPTPPDPAVEALARWLPEIDPAPTDRVALAAGGGHYAPHFTDLTLRRSWAFGHILSRHALGGLSGETAAAAWTATPGAEGIVFARAEDARGPLWQGLGPRLRDQDAPARPAPTSASRWASGT